MDNQLRIGDISKNLEVLDATVRKYNEDTDEEAIYLEARLKNITDKLLEEVRCDASYFDEDIFLGLDKSDALDLDKIAPYESIGIEIELCIPKATTIIVFNAHSVIETNEVKELGSLLRGLFKKDNKKKE